MLLELSGSGFVYFYAFLLADGLLAAYQLRQWLRGPDEEGGPQDRDLEPYAIALLAGKESRAADTVLASLYARGLLSLDPQTGLARQPVPPEELSRLHPLERDLLDRLPSSGKSFASLHEEARWLAAHSDLLERLISRGLIHTSTRALLIQFLPACIIAAVFYIGLMKLRLSEGLAFPSEYLLCLLAVTLACAVVPLARPSWRTRRGDRVYEALRREHSALQVTASSSGGSPLPGRELLPAIGLFGLEAVNLPELVEFQPLLKAQAQAQAQSQSSSTTLCGGCGGGGGGGDAGGGDGCGGGCGGCGGCGG